VRWSSDTAVEAGKGGSGLLDALARKGAWLVGEHSITKFRPVLEPLEEKRPLSASAATAPLVNQGAGSPALISAANATKPDYGYLVYRITNPNAFNNKLIPPFSQLLVQSHQPIPGQVYNVLYLAVRNGTAQTFDANSGFRVRFPGQRQSFPILAGSEQWKPGQEFVFYVLTKRYYPVPSIVNSGFEFDLGGAYSAAIPGPSGIFLRLKYNPAKFARTLNEIVAYGQGAQGGKGPKFGLPDTAIYELLSAKTRRIDFGGYF
jgi:hypothetical protein